MYLRPRQAPFGRADKAANWLLRARLYLNAGVYTGQTDYAKAEEYASKVIGSAYKLCTNYSELFMADNDENENAMQEIILPIRQDGVKTRNYGGSTYLVCGTRVAGMPRMGTTERLVLYLCPCSNGTKVLLQSRRCADAARRC